MSYPTIGQEYHTALLYSALALKGRPGSPKRPSQVTVSCAEHTCQPTPRPPPASFHPTPPTCLLPAGVSKLGPPVSVLFPAAESTEGSRRSRHTATTTLSRTEVYPRMPPGRRRAPQSGGSPGCVTRHKSRTQKFCCIG